MLREIRVRDLAVVENATVPFGPGLNVLTGETGAGKSILVDAILLVRGARGQAEMIRAEADRATVEAVFELPAGSPARGLLEEAGLAGDAGEVLVRRELGRGRHRAFVNDSPVTVGLLERLGDHLVEIHGQHEHQRLLEPLRQLELLDRFAGTEGRREAVAERHDKYRAAREAVDAMRSAERDRAQRIDMLRFQVGELDAARIRAGEEAELRAERLRLQHAERFAAGLAQVAALLRDDADAALARLARAARALRDLGRLDPAFAAPAAALDTAAADVEDALLALRPLAQSIESEPGRLPALEDRLDALGRLRRKYGDTEEALLAYRAAAAAELERLERHDELLAAEEGRLEELRAEVLGAARELSEVREAAGRRLGALVQRQLRALGMERARFEVQVVRRADGDVGPRGLDHVEFRLAANPGEEARPLGRVASGGELSRTMLALHAVLAASQPVPTMVFDEVDAGVGGRTAAVVAEALAAAAAGRQVLCVTHLPPVAARAAHHLAVVKTVRGGRTRVTVTQLTGADRVDEVARMLGGPALTEAARRHAGELLGERPG